MVSLHPRCSLNSSTSRPFAFEETPQPCHHLHCMTFSSSTVQPTNMNQCFGVLELPVTWIVTGVRRPSRRRAAHPVSTHPVVVCSPRRHSRSRLGANVLLLVVAHTCCPRIRWLPVPVLVAAGSWVCRLCHGYNCMRPCNARSTSCFQCSPAKLSTQGAPLTHAALHN